MGKINGERKMREKSKKFKEVDKLINEGDQAFKQENSFEGIEKYKKGLKILKEMNKNDKTMEYLSKLSKICLSNNHYTLAEQFSKELFKIAETEGSLYYMGEAKYIIGSICIVQNNIKVGSEAFQQAAIFFEFTPDYFGTGLSNQKIGLIYSTQLKDFDRASLFFIEAIKNFDKALYEIHPLRKSIQDNPEIIWKKIKDLRETVKKSLDKIFDPIVRSKISEELLEREKREWKERESLEERREREKRNWKEKKERKEIGKRRKGKKRKREKRENW